MKAQNEIRTKAHQRNSEVESILHEMQQYLGAPEMLAVEQLPVNNLPNIYIVGCARSGTTLCYQYLAASGLFCYPSNFLSRFYYAPYIGAQLQKLLFELDTKGETSSPSGLSFSSELGKTKGPLSPHEFWYFWNRFFRFGETQQLTDADLKQADTTTFLKELNAVKHVFQKPLLLKAMNMNFHIDFLHSLYTPSLIVFIERDALYNAQSLLQARANFFGDTAKWYSYKTPAYESLKNVEPEKQVVAQVRENNNAIKSQLQKLPAEAYLHYTYRQFCENPDALLRDIIARLKMNGANTIELPQIFACNEKQVTNDASWNKLKRYAGE